MPVLALAISAEATRAEPSPQEQVFQELLAKHQDTESREFLATIPRPAFLSKLPFDPTTARFFPEAAKGLHLDVREIAVFREKGFVSFENEQRYSFPSAYYDIYAHDLPVLITSDSILHALHRSYDDVLMELEAQVFHDLLTELLEACHAKLAEWRSAGTLPLPLENASDVDLYLSVARNLLAGAGADVGWDGKLAVPTALGQDDQALQILAKVRSLEMPSLDQPPNIALYGGERYLDFSQFKPRGHYTRGLFENRRRLENYYRCLMWLGRADCGWNLLPETTPGSVTKGDPEREVRDAVLMTELLKETGGLARLRAMDEVLEFLVGTSDNLSPRALAEFMEKEGIRGTDVKESAVLVRLQKAVSESRLAAQRIRSQVVFSNVYDEVKVPPPRIFQFFGQRFVLDSFILSQVVFDSIIFEHQKVRRMMPSGLDVMAALGNDQAVRLLEKELTTYPYAANLAASREFVKGLAPTFWKENLYHVWLDALRTLDDPPDSPHAPSIIRTEAWQKKQLQAQLASWSELRRDTVLYTKQSYTGGPTCEYPKGYVEPYPELYARAAFFAREAGRRVGAVDWPSLAKKRPQELAEIRNRQTAFFADMERVLAKLDTLARKELGAEPFSAEEQVWLKKTIDRRGGGSGPPRYDGWYADLLYCTRAAPQNAAAWDPVIADVHTDPESRQVLEVGTGNTRLLLAAIDNDKDLSVYVGPVYSYYEFPSAKRLTDEEWQEMFPVGEDRAPAWASEFHVAALGPALLRAVREGDLTQIRAIIAQGADVNSLISERGRETRLLLHAGRLDVLQTLLDAGADPNARDARGHNALDFLFASRSARREFVEALLAHGADPRLVGPDGTALHEAARNGDLPLVHLFLERGVPVDVRDARGQTPLHRAVNSPFVSGVLAQVVRRLAEAGADVNAEDKDGSTPILLLQSRNPLESVGGAEALEVARFLIEKGAQLPASAAVLAAAAPADTGLLELVISRGADVNARDLSGRPALQVAAIAAGRMGAATIDHGPRLRKIRLLLRAGADVRAVDRDGNTALHSIMKTHRTVEMVQALVEAGADVNARNKNGEVPLNLLLERCTIWPGEQEEFGGIVTYLLDEGADPFLSENPRPAIHLAAWCGAAATKPLLSRNADVNARDNYRRTPLHRAVESASCKTEVTPDTIGAVRELLDAGADVNARDARGATPLHVSACEVGRKEVLQLLIRAGAEVNAQDDDGRTPLHQVLRNPRDVAGRRKELLSALFHAGADPRISDTGGVLPVDLIRHDPALAPLLQTP